MKIVKDLEESGLGICLWNCWKEVKEQRGGFLSMLAATLAAKLLGSPLTGKGVAKGGYGVIGESERTNRAGKDFYCRLIL